jgi:large subunit ribosomal protein L25
MERILLKAEKRTERGKSEVRALRRHGLLPAVLYNKGDSTPIKLPRKEIATLMVSGRGEHTLFNIELSSDKSKKKTRWAIVKDYQVDPVKNELLHIDFMEISLEKEIKMTVPIVITKEPVGIKKGGILQQQMREIEIECLPTEIPDGIEVDASSVDIGHSLHVSDLVVKEGVKILSDPKEVILTVSAPIVEEVTPIVEEIKEPELVRKAKPKEEEEAAEEEQKGQKEQKTQKEKD